MQAEVDDGNRLKDGLAWRAVRDKRGKGRIGGIVAGRQEEEGDTDVLTNGQEYDSESRVGRYDREIISDAHEQSNRKG